MLRRQLHNLPVSVPKTGGVRDAGLAASPCSAPERQILVIVYYLLAFPQINVFLNGSEREREREREKTDN